MPNISDKQSEAISQSFDNLARRLHRTPHYDIDDFGFLVVMALADSVGNTVFDDKIYAGDKLVAKSLTYRMNGHYLSLAYWDIQNNKYVQKDIRV